MSGLTEPVSEDELLGQIEALIARRGRLKFPAWLVSRFEADTGARYAQILSDDLLRSVVYYNLFIFGDFLLTPDTVLLAATLHALVVTPCMLASAFFCRSGARPLARDAAGALVPLLIACQILWVFARSASPNVSDYLFFVTLNALTCNSSLRLRYRAAAATTVATFLALVATLAAAQKIPIQVSVMHAFSFGVCGLVSLKNAADREREFRRAYLHGLRDQLRISASDAEASRDALTGAANRRGLNAAARAAWGGVAAPVSVILFDVDNFKAFNDLYGHLAGDGCLKKIGVCTLAMLAELAGREATLARYGGEEFLALLTGTAATQGEEVAEALRRTVLSLSIPHRGAAAGGIVSASFGVASGRSGDVGFEALVAAADAAMYRSKSAGRNKVSLARAA